MPASFWVLGSEAQKRACESCKARRVQSLKRTGGNLRTPTWSRCSAGGKAMSVQATRRVAVRGLASTPWRSCCCRKANHGEWVAMW